MSPASRQGGFRRPAYRSTATASSPASVTYAERPFGATAIALGESLRPASCARLTRPERRVRGSTTATLASFEFATRRRVRLWADGVVVVVSLPLATAIPCGCFPVWISRVFVPPLVAISVMTLARQSLA